MTYWGSNSLRTLTHWQSRKAAPLVGEYLIGTYINWNLVPTLISLNPESFGFTYIGTSAYMAYQPTPTDGRAKIDTSSGVAVFNRQYIIPDGHYVDFTSGGSSYGYTFDVSGATITSPNWWDPTLNNTAWTGSGLNVSDIYTFMSVCIDTTVRDIMNLSSTYNMNGFTQLLIDGMDAYALFLELATGNYTHLPAWVSRTPSTSATALAQLIAQIQQSFQSAYNYNAYQIR